MKTYELFVRSPLAAEASPAIADALDVIYRNESVQLAAGACSAKRQRLIELAGFKAEVSAAIQLAIDRGDGAASLTPAVVAEVLRQRADDIDSAIDDCREDHAAHHAASKERMARHKPLRAAVSKRLDQLIVERNRLIQDDDAEGRATSIGLSGASRYAVLRSVGLSDGQIAATEPAALSPEVLVARRRTRIAVISRQIESLLAFSTSPTFDAAAIGGIDPAIDALVAARGGEKVAAT